MVEGPIGEDDPRGDVTPTLAVRTSVKHPACDAAPECARFQVTSLGKNCERRGRDSNPRGRSTPPTRFPVALLKPLGHLSVSARSVAGATLDERPMAARAGV